MLNLAAEVKEFFKDMKSSAYFFDEQQKERTWY